MGMQKELAGLSAGALADARRGFRAGVDGIGAYERSAVTARTATSRFTEQLVKQDLTLKQAIKSRKLFNATLKEQYQLQKLMAVQWSRGSVTGKVSADAIVPRGSGAAVDKLTSSFGANYKAMRLATKGTADYAAASQIMQMRLGMMNQVLASGAANMIKWGKNTQWAGRQLMVGFTVPFAALAAVSAKAFYNLDKGLTSITKVYDTYATEGIAREQELAQVRESSIEVAKGAARQYGAAIKDTLDVEQQLAATGMRGVELYKNTATIQKAATVGQMDYNKATQAAITLQTVFNMNSAQVSDSFAYMSAVANATSLTMEDFSAALPRVGSVVKQLGGNLQDVGLLLTAMRAQSISAEQGANAIKSAAASMIKPTKQASKILRGYGINLEAISAKNAGNVVKNFIDLSAALNDANLSPDKFQKAMVAVFGKYQLGRVNAMVMGLRDVNKEGTQMNRAFELAAQGAEEWQRVFSNALEQSQNSASGKFKRAIESFKSEFATIGKSFLEVGTGIIHAATNLAKLFNSLPDGVKKATLFGMAIFAIIGPIIMLTGLFANMFGQIMRFGASLAGLKLKFKAQTAEQRIEAMLADKSSVAWANQADAARALSAQLGILTNNLARVAAEQRAAAGLPPVMMGGPVRRNANVISASSSLQTKQVSYRNSNGTFASAAAFQAQMAAASSTTARNWSLIGQRMQGAAITAGFVGSMVAGSNKLISQLSTALIIAGLIGPTIVKGLIKAAAVAKASKLGTIIAGSISGSAVSRSVGKLGTMLMAVAKSPVGLGIAAAAATSLYIWKKTSNEMSRARKEGEKIVEGTSDWANLLGFVEVKVGQIKNVNGDVVDTSESIARKWAEANKSIAEYVRQLHAAGNQQGVVNEAIRQGLKVLRMGGDAAQAYAAAATVLTAAGYKKDEVKDIMVRIHAQVDFNSDKSTLDAQMEQFKSDFEKIANDKFKEGGWEKIFSSSILSGKTKGAAKGLADTFWEAWSEEDQQGRLAMFDRFEKVIGAQQTSFYAKLGDKAKSQLEAMGITNMAQLAEKYYSSDAAAGSILGAVGGRAGDLQETLAGEEQVAQAIAKENGLTKEQIANIHTVAQLRAVLDQATMTTVDAEKAYNDAITESSHLLGGPLSEAYKLSILNGYRHAAGLGDATNSAQGFDAVINGINTTLGANGLALDASVLSLDDWKNGMQEAMKGAQSFAIEVANSFKSMADSSATDAIQKRAQAAQDALDESAARMDKKFDKRADAINDKYEKMADDRSKGVKKQIDVEKAAEEQRKRMFEAEKQRIERMANLANMNIDFNLQLSQGNFDEAAKIGNDIQATQVGYDLEDSDKAAETAADARQKTLEAKEKLEDDALEKKKKRELEALDAERERYRKEIDAQRKAIQEKAQNDIEAARLSQERRARTLELELSVIRASVPRTKAEYDKQIAQIEAAYSRYGVNLKAKGDEWTKVIGVGLDQNIAIAAAGLQNTIDWKAIGANIIGELTGFTPEAFRTWITTGKMPTGPSAAAKPEVTAWAPPKGMSWADVTRHEGGLIDSGSGSRKGYSASSSVNPSEKRVLAQKGEFMVQKSAVDKFGIGFLDMINKGQMPGGFAAPIALSAGALLTSMFRSALSGGAVAPNVAIPPGSFGDTKLSKEQLTNAHRILTVGRRMGASKRDLVVSLMTAMQESRLINVDYGDRDSLGLFQQRPSQGWGTPVQVMNPEYAATQFFKHLLAIKDRNKMPLTLEAQAVQRSAYPNAYAKWAPLASALVNIPGLKVGGDIRWDNTVANLHKGEKVLTAPLSKQLENGIAKIDQGVANEYTLKVDLRGATIRENVDIEKAVETVLDKREAKFGRSRKIG